MIHDTQRVELEIFQSIENSFDNIVMEIIIYLTTNRMKSMGSRIKRFNLEVVNWTYEVLIRLGFIEILLG